jgi:hypothetical protein
MSRGWNNDRLACGSPVALIELLLEVGRPVVMASFGSRDAVDRRDDVVEGGCVINDELEAMRRAWSLPSRIGQLRARAPITSICLRREPWSQ